MDLSTVVSRVKQWLDTNLGWVLAKVSAPDEATGISVVVTAVDQKALDRWTTWLVKAAEKAKGLAISTAEQFQDAVQSALALRDLEDDVKRAQKAALEPLREEAERIKALHGPLAEGLGTARQLFEAKAGEWDRAEKRRLLEEQQRLERERQESERKLREAEEAAVAAARAGIGSDAVKQLDLAAGEAYLEHQQVVTAQPVVPSRPVGSVTAAGSFTTREERDFRIVDLNKVPREYLKLDPAAVKAALKRGVADIPGLELFPVPVNSTRRKRAR